LLAAASNFSTYATVAHQSAPHRRKIRWWRRGASCQIARYPSTQHPMVPVSQISTVAKRQPSPIPPPWALRPPPSTFRSPFSAHPSPYTSARTADGLDLCVSCIECIVCMHRTHRSGHHALPLAQVPVPSIAEQLSSIAPVAGINHFPTSHGSCHEKSRQASFRLGVGRTQGPWLTAATEIIFQRRAPYSSAPGNRPALHHQPKYSTG